MSSTVQTQLAAKDAARTTQIDELLNSKSADKLQVFIMSWNMGNAPESGLQYVFSEKNANNAYDIIVLGLQESTYKTKDGVDCVTQLSNTIETIMGNKYFKVYFFSLSYTYMLFSC